jgi:hypothetical protein
MATQAGAHGFGRGWHHGFFGQNAIVTGTVTSVGNGSFGANAYLLTPGAGGGSASTTTTPVTITEGTNTKVAVLGQSGVTVGDTFYATYKGESSTTPIATLVAGTPSKVFAFVAPTPQVEVSGVITAVSPTTDQFTATASVAQPRFGGSPWSPPTHGPIMGGPVSQAGTSGTSYSYGGNVGGSYGFAGSSARVAHDSHSRWGGGSTTGTPNTTVTTDSATTFDVNGTSGLTIGSVAVGDTFTATFDGTPSESLADIVANPALSVTAHTATTHAQNTLYAFVGTVSGTDTTTSPETVSVNVTESTPTGLFTGTDTFDVGPSTFVLGGAGGSLLGSLSNIATGDVIAGGLVSTGSQAASAIEADPLQVLVDFPASSSSSTSAAALRHARRADLKKAMKLLRKDRDRFGGKHKKH